MPMLDPCYYNWLWEWRRTPAIAAGSVWPHSALRDNGKRAIENEALSLQIIVNVR